MALICWIVECRSIGEHDSLILYFWFGKQALEWCFWVHKKPIDLKRRDKWEGKRAAPSHTPQMVCETFNRTFTCGPLKKHFLHSCPWGRISNHVVENAKGNFLLLRFFQSFPKVCINDVSCLSSRIYHLHDIFYFIFVIFHFISKFKLKLDGILLNFHVVMYEHVWGLAGLFRLSYFAWVTLLFPFTFSIIWKLSPTSKPPIHGVLQNSL